MQMLPVQGKWKDHSLQLRKKCKNNWVGTVIHWELFKWLGFGHENTNFEYKPETA